MQLLARLLGLFFNLFEPLFRLGQRVLGVSRIGWMFVAPNLVVFGLFTFLPIVINFVYAATGGSQRICYEHQDSTSHHHKSDSIT